MKKIRINLALLLLGLGFFCILFKQQIVFASPLNDKNTRTIFVGDSRTVDMFYKNKTKINNKNIDGLRVYAKDGARFPFLKKTINKVGLKNFDTLVVWMGANDGGDFSKYKKYYNWLLKKKKKIVVLSVGPTCDENLYERRKFRYKNANIIEFNSQLHMWASSRNVKYVDLYSYINSSSCITLDPEDGLHYIPKPTKTLWNYILKKIRIKHKIIC